MSSVRAEQQKGADRQLGRTSIVKIFQTGLQSDAPHVFDGNK